MKLHLVDATFELFRAFYSPGRGMEFAPDGRPVNAVHGLVDSMLALLREPDVTHIAAATDHVIESWRNDVFPGYKSSVGLPPELLSQFDDAERALRALGIVTWAMVEDEADDAIATAVARFSGDERLEQIVICSVDKDLAQCVDDDRIVLRDRIRRVTYDEAGVVAKFGVAPGSIPDYLALVGDSSRPGRMGSPQLRSDPGTLQKPRYDPGVAAGLGCSAAGRLAARGRAAGSQGRGAAVSTPRAPQHRCGDHRHARRPRLGRSTAFGVPRDLRRARFRAHS